MLKKSGFLLIGFSIILSVTDRFPHILSDTLGRSLCGDSHLLRWTLQEFHAFSRCCRA